MENALSYATLSLWVVLNEEQLALINKGTMYTLTGFTRKSDAKIALNNQSSLPFGTMPNIYLMNFGLDAFKFERIDIGLDKRSGSKIRGMRISVRK